MIFSSRGILGINARNQKYLRAPKRALRILDSKLLTKKILEENNLPVLKTIAVVKTRKELLDFDWSVLPPPFALKPNRGLGGEGIIVVYGKRISRIRDGMIEEPAWIRSRGSFISKVEIESHILDILDGNFSMFSLPDVAFFEERAKVVKELKPYSFKGIPDVRIIVYEGVPVMAMLRLPTKESRGKANLHAGGIGVGIDLSTGLTTNAIYRQKLIDYCPGTKYLLRGIRIPFFKKNLNLAVQAQRLLGVSFLGIDIVVDKEKGPVILELNARPGLQIQLANLSGMRGRIERLMGLELKSEKRGVRLAQDLFGEIEEEEIDEVFGKKVLGAVEEIKVVRPNGDTTAQEYKTLAKIDTGAWRTSLSEDLAKKMGVKNRIVGEKIVKSSFGEEVRQLIPLAFILGGERVDTEVYISDRSSMKYEIIIGRRDLKNFMIDPARKNTIKIL
ncbi:MAG: sugar-transfer associated ATP-grasp domain-containing protein [Patescibacteria group bacterium]